MKLSLIETLAYKKKPGWTPTDNVPLDIMGDKAQDSGVQAQDFQAILLKTEERLIKTLTELGKLKSNIVHQLDHYELKHHTDPNTEEDEVEIRRLGTLRSSIFRIYGIVFRAPAILKELRRRIGISRQESVLNKLAVNIAFIASETLSRLNSVVDENSAPEVVEYQNKFRTILSELESTANMMARSKKFDMNMAYMGHSIKVPPGYGKMVPGERKRNY